MFSLTKAGVCFVFVLAGSTLYALWWAQVVSSVSQQI